MKKVFETPKMAISVFDTEEIRTADTSAVKLAQDYFKTSQPQVGQKIYVLR